jgi:hypothetical protein
MRVTRTLVAATMLLILSFGFASLGIWPASVSGDVGPQKVQVVNTPLPVSVQGPTSVSASQSGAWNVGLTAGASVNVANTASAPIPVRILDEREPVRLQGGILGQDVACAAGNLFSESDDTRPYTVPDGKRLVIEQVSGYAQLEPSHRYRNVILEWKKSKESGHLLFPVPQFTGSDGVDNYQFNELSRAYVEASLSVSFFVCRDTVSGSSNFGITVSGYLTPVP